MNLALRIVVNTCLPVAVLAGFIVTPAVARQADQKILKNLSIKRVDSSIAKQAEKGLVPVDAIVESNGKRAKFTVRMVKLAQPTKWIAKFALGDDKFDSLFEINEQKKFRIIWHEVYETKAGVQHAAIWHYDPTLTPLTDEAARNASVRPEPVPLGTVWQPEARIPIQSEGLPEFGELEEQTVAFMKANQMPGLSIATSLDGKLLYQGSFGYSDPRRKTAMRLGQPMRLSSLSRIITVVATLQLVDQGKLRLDQPVYPLLGVAPWKKESFDARSNDVTVLHLLQETGGHDGRTFEPGFSPRTVADRMGLKTVATQRNAVEYMLSQPLAYTPGDQSAASSYGFFLLGRVIEKVSGKSYEEFVLENIAKPLKLTSLTMSRTDPDQRKSFEARNVARDGVWCSQLAGKDAGKWVQPNDGGYHFGLLDACHGWMITPGDLLRLAGAIQQNPSPILSAESKVLLIAKPAHVLKREQQEGKAVRAWKGCAFFCQSSPKGITFWRHAQAVNASAGLVCLSSSGVSFCYIFNCGTTAAGEDPRRDYDPMLNKASTRIARSVKGR